VYSHPVQHAFIHSAIMHHHLSAEPGSIAVVIDACLLIDHLMPFLLVHLSALATTFACCSSPCVASNQPPGASGLSSRRCVFQQQMLLASQYIYRVYSSKCRKSSRPGMQRIGEVLDGTVRTAAVERLLKTMASQICTTKQRYVDVQRVRTASECTASPVTQPSSCCTRHALQDTRPSRARHQSARRVALLCLCMLD